MCRKSDQYQARIQLWAAGHNPAGRNYNGPSHADQDHYSAIFLARWCFFERIAPGIMVGCRPGFQTAGSRQFAPFRPLSGQLGSQVMPEPKDHTQDRNFIEDILRRVPGFRGYLEKEYRRESDDLQRDALADRLQRAKRSIDDASRQLVEAGQIDVLPQFDRMRGQLDKLIGRIRGAVQGYSGFFDLVRVDEPLLERVYEHDLAMMDQVDQLGQKIEQLPEQTEPSVQPIMDLIDQLQQRWDEREDMLKGLK